MLWQQLVGIAKYLSRTGQSATRIQLLDKLGIGDRALKLGFQTLELLGFTLRFSDNAFHVSWQEQPSHLSTDTALAAAVEQFAIAVKEEQFRRQYFYQVPLATMQAVAQAASAERIVPLNLDDPQGTASSIVLGRG